MKKHPLLSKTVWVQIITIISTLVPAVSDWLGSNGVTIIQVLGAVNIVVRFVTHGKISVFSDGESGNGGSGTHLLLAMCIVGGTLGCGFLASCSALETVDAKIYYKDADSGAKGGIDLVPGKKPSWWLRLPEIRRDSNGLNVEVRPLVLPQRDPVLDAATPTVTPPITPAK